MEGRPPLDGTAPTIEFSDGGKLGGNDTSNRFTSSFVRQGYGLAVGPVASTLMFKDEPPGAMQQEQFYLSLLQQVDSFSLRDGKLDLLIDGKTAMTFD